MINNLEKTRGINLVDIDGKLLKELYIREGRKINKEDESVLVAVIDNEVTQVVGSASVKEMMVVSASLIENISRLSGQSIIDVGTILIAGLMAKQQKEQGFGSVADDISELLRRMREGN